MITKKYKVEGMDCASCAMVIESDLEDAGFKAKCDFVKEELEVQLEKQTQEQEVKQIVKSSGYNLV